MFVKICQRRTRTLIFRLPIDEYKQTVDSAVCIIVCKRKGEFQL